jgi:hypothetical protein
MLSQSGYSTMVIVFRFVKFFTTVGFLIDRKFPLVTQESATMMKLILLLLLLL